MPKDVSLLNDPVAQELLKSTIPARLAYVALDGTPRVVPVWFVWNRTDIVMGTPAPTSKVAAMRKNPRVAFEIDTDVWPYKVLSIRGSVTVEVVDGVTPEYTQAAHHYFGPRPANSGRTRSGACSSRSRDLAPAGLGEHSRLRGTLPSADCGRYGRLESSYFAPGILGEPSGASIWVTLSRQASMP